MKRLGAGNLLPVFGLCVGLGAGFWGWWSAGVHLPLFHLGVSLTLLAVFGVIWLFGIRYRDVAWMVVISAILTLDALVSAHPAVMALDSKLAARELTRFALMAAFLAFLLSFFRIQFGSRKLELTFFGATALFAVALGFLPAELHAALGMTGQFQNYAGGVFLLAGVVAGLSTLSGLPAKRRRYVLLVAATALVGGFVYLVQARWGRAGAAFFAPFFDYFLAGFLALFLVADLVVFHRDYFKEKASRMWRDQEEVRLEATREFGRAVQDLLLPKDKQGLFGDFAFEFYFRPATVAGGDWMFIWDSQERERRLVFGEVQAGAQQLGLGVAAVIGLLHECKSRQMTLLAAAQYVNARLIDIFGHRITASFMAVSMGMDGTVEVFNCGGAGFFQLSRDGLHYHAMNSPPLGVSESLSVEQCALPLSDADLLFAGTSGVFGAATNVRRIIDHFDDDFEPAPDLAAVRDLILQLTAGSLVSDGSGGDQRGDRMILTLQKAASSYLSRQRSSDALEASPHPNRTA